MDEADDQRQFFEDLAATARQSVEQARGVGLMAARSRAGHRTKPLRSASAIVQHRRFRASALTPSINHNAVEADFLFSLAETK